MPIEKSAGHNTSTDQKTKPPEGGFLKSGRTSQIIRRFASHPFGALVAGSDVVSLRSARTASAHLTRPENKKPRLREALLYLVGLVRFELTTFAMSTRRSNQLSYSPEVERIIPTVGSGSSLV